MTPTIAQAENHLSRLLAAARVTDNVFVGTLPPTIDADCQDMALIDLQTQHQHGPYLYGTANIYLYARPTGRHPTKNVRRLNEMEQALQQALQSHTDDTFHVSDNWNSQGFDQQRNFHYNIHNIDIATT